MFSSPVTWNEQSQSYTKKNFASGTFRGMGCKACPQVSVPAVIKTSADLEANKVKKKKGKTINNKECNPEAGCSNINGISNNQSSSSCVGVHDVWCSPGIGLPFDSAFVDCVVPRRPVSGRRKVDGDNISHRENPLCSARRIISEEGNPFVESDYTVGITDADLDAFRCGYHLNDRNGIPEELSQKLIFRGRLLMGGRLDTFDRHKDWRLDIDCMSYEELLDLSERIGYACTGLREDEISRCVRKLKPSVQDSILLQAPEKEKKCSICQEEYDAGGEKGKLKCGHFFHMQCIKLWLLQKNSCPMCKSTALHKGS